jgi:dihydroorotate dehydrogenase (fumarate)
MDLSTEYLGLELKTPIIAASSPLTADSDKLFDLERAGVGAIVLKSLFEEQILAEKVEPALDPSAYLEHPEAEDYIQQIATRLLGPGEYLELIKEAKRLVSIPVIASINCLPQGNWMEYARQIEEAGADALELNLSFFQSDLSIGGQEVDAQYLRVVKNVLSTVSLPVAVKIGPYFSSLGSLVAAFADLGVKAVVLFNRFYPLDFDLKTKQLKSKAVLSHPLEQVEALRWISILSGQVKIDFAANKGIHNGADALKMIMAGAQVIQVASCLIEYGPEYAETLIKGLGDAMVELGYQNLASCRGVLSQIRSGNPREYERLQYVKALSAGWGKR